MATHASPLVAPATEMSFEEFLVAYDGVHAEWVDGRVHVMSPGNDRQSTLTRFLGAIIQEWAEVHDLGEVYAAPYTVRTRKGAGREPDLFFLRADNQDRVRGSYVEGPPDLVIEIVSPGSRGQDRGAKFHEYAQAEIPEYWLIDPERSTAEAYRLSGGSYQPVDLGEPPALRSEALPGMWIAVEWLWRQPLPKQGFVRAEWRIA